MHEMRNPDSIKLALKKPFASPSLWLLTRKANQTLLIAAHSNPICMANKVDPCAENSSDKTHPKVTKIATHNFMLAKMVGMSRFLSWEWIFIAAMFKPKSSRSEAIPKTATEYANDAYSELCSTRANTRLRTIRNPLLSAVDAKMRERSLIENNKLLIRLKFLPIVRQLIKER